MIRAKKIPQLAGLALMFLVHAAAAAGTDAPDSAGLARVQAYLDGTETLRAHFRQTVVESEGRVTQTSSGVLTIARPNRFRWDYAEPYEQLVLADGERLWLYDADLEQVTVRELDASLDSTPAMLLSGGGRVTDAFRAGEISASGELLGVELIPLEENSDFQSVTVDFEGEKLVSMKLQDALGQSTRIEFLRLERNVALDDDAFAFEPPEGVDVIGATAP